MKVIMTPNMIIRRQVKEALKENGGYCPCQVKSEDTKCPCKSFKELNEPGECVCGLFRKVEDSED